MFGEVCQQVWQSDLDELEQVAHGKSQLKIGISSLSETVSSMYRWALSANVWIENPFKPGVLSGGLVTF